MQPVLGYRSKAAAIRALKAEGLSSAQIGERLGMTGTQVSNMAYSAMRAISAERPAETGKRQRVYLSLPTINGLVPHAEKRGIAVTTLVQRLVETILHDDMVDAVLDDQEPVA